MRQHVSGKQCKELGFRMIVSPAFLLCPGVTPTPVLAAGEEHSLSPKPKRVLTSVTFSQVVRGWPTLFGGQPAAVVVQPKAVQG